MRVYTHNFARTLPTYAYHLPLPSTTPRYATMCIVLRELLLRWLGFRHLAVFGTGRRTGTGRQTPAAGRGQTSGQLPPVYPHLLSVTSHFLYSSPVYLDFALLPCAVRGRHCFPTPHTLAFSLPLHTHTHVYSNTLTRRRCTLLTRLYAFTPPHPTPTTLYLYPHTTPTPPHTPLPYPTLPTTTHATAFPRTRLRTHTPLPP